MENIRVSFRLLVIPSIVGPLERCNRQRKQQETSDGSGSFDSGDDSRHVLNFGVCIPVDNDKCELSGGVDLRAEMRGDNNKFCCKGGIDY